MRKKLILIAPLAIAGIAIFMALGGELVKLLWNWLTPTLFGWRQITFWQAFGLLILCRILFGGPGVMRRTAGRTRRRVTERWEQMTPEERERYRQSFRGRWGSCEPSASKPTA